MIATAQRTTRTIRRDRPCGGSTSGRPVNTQPPGGEHRPRTGIGYAPTVVSAYRTIQTGGALDGSRAHRYSTQPVDTMGAQA